MGSNSGENLKRSNFRIKSEIYKCSLRPNYYLNQNIILYLMRMETTVVYLNFTDVNLDINVANVRLSISTTAR